MPRRQRRRIPSSNPSRTSDQVDPFISLISRQTFRGTQRAISNLAAGDMPRPKSTKAKNDQQWNDWSSNPPLIAPRPGEPSDVMTQPPANIASPNQPETNRQGSRRPPSYENVQGFCVLSGETAVLKLSAAVKNQKGMSGIDIKELHVRNLGCEVKLFPVKKYRYKDKTNKSVSWKAIGQTKILVQKLDGDLEGMVAMVWQDNVPFELVIHKSLASAILFPGEPQQCLKYPGDLSASVQAASVGETRAAMPNTCCTEAGHENGTYGQATNFRPETSTPLPPASNGFTQTNPNLILDGLVCDGHLNIGQSRHVQGERVADGQNTSGNTIDMLQRQAVAGQAEGGLDIQGVGFPGVECLISLGLQDPAMRLVRDYGDVTNWGYAPGTFFGTDNQQSTIGCLPMEWFSSSDGTVLQDNAPFLPFDLGGENLDGSSFAGGSLDFQGDEQAGVALNHQSQYGSGLEYLPPGELSEDNAD